MAPRSRVLYDKTEIVVIDVSGKKAVVHNLPYDRVVRIQFDPFTARSLFKSIPSEKISITIRGREEPIVLLQHKEKAFFDQYKADLAKFAKDNRISFQNNLPQ